MTENKAIEIIKYVKTFDGMDYGTTKIALDMAIKALGTVGKLREMVDTLERNLSFANTCTAIDLSDDYEKCKYDAYYKCLVHLKEILG